MHFPPTILRRRRRRKKRRRAAADWKKDSRQYYVDHFRLRSPPSQLGARLGTPQGRWAHFPPRQPSGAARHKSPTRRRGAVCGQGREKQVPESESRPRWDKGVRGGRHESRSAKLFLPNGRRDKNSQEFSQARTAS